MILDWRALSKDQLKRFICLKSLLALIMLNIFPSFY